MKKLHWQLAVRLSVTIISITVFSELWQPLGFVVAFVIWIIMYIQSIRLLMR